MGFNFHVGLPGPFSYTARLTGRRRHRGGPSGAQVVLDAAAEHLKRDVRAQKAALITLIVLASLDVFLGLPVLIVSVGGGLFCVISGALLLTAAIVKLRRLNAS